MTDSTKNLEENSTHWGVSRRRLFMVLFVVISVSTAYFVVQSHHLFDEVISSITSFKTTEGRNFLRASQSETTPDQFVILARTALETDTIDARHNRSTSALVTRTWLRFTSAAFGAILIAIGAIFILSRVTIDTTKFEGGWENAKISLVFNSPGIFLVVIGAFLLALPITSNQKINTDDTASFFEKLNPTGSRSSAIIDNMENRTKAFCEIEPKPDGC